MLKLENSIRGLSFSRVAFDLTIQGLKTAFSIIEPFYVGKVKSRLLKGIFLLAFKLHSLLECFSGVFVLCYNDGNIGC